MQYILILFFFLLNSTQILSSHPTYCSLLPSLPLFLLNNKSPHKALVSLTFQSGEMKEFLQRRYNCPGRSKNILKRHLCPPLWLLDCWNMELQETGIFPWVCCEKEKLGSPVLALAWGGAHLNRKAFTQSWFVRSVYLGIGTEIVAGTVQVCSGPLL